MKRVNNLLALVFCGSVLVWAQPLSGAKDTKPAHAGHKAASAEKAASKPTAPNMGAFTPDKLQWGPAPDVLPPGAQLAVVEGDPAKSGPYTMRLKMPAGYKISPHHHARREHVTVLSGEFKVGMGDSFDASKMSTFSAGSFAWLEPSAHHYALASKETVIQLHGAGPWEIIYIHPADDPRKAKK